MGILERLSLVLNVHIEITDALEIRYTLIRYTLIRYTLIRNTIRNNYGYK